MIESFKKNEYPSLQLNWLIIIFINSIDEFMRSQSKVLSQDQLLAFFRRVSNNNVISYPQFVELITPVEPSPSYIANSSRLGSSSRGFR